MLPAFAYFRGPDIADAIRLLETQDARILAGGTDLLPCLRERIFPARTLVSLGAIPDIRGVTRTAEDGLSLGAMTAIAELATSAEISSRLPGLAEAALAVGSPQLRNQGTVGGNLCQKPRCWYYRGEFPCLRKGGDRCHALGGDDRFHCILGGQACYIVHPSDLAPMLLALDAQAWIAGPAGHRSLALDDFFVPPATDPTRETHLQAGEILTHLHLAPPAEGLRTRYRKVRLRQAWDFALAGVALALQLDGDAPVAGRVVCSGVAPVPWRSLEAEAVIMNRPLTPARCREAARAALAPAKALAGNAYKIPLLTNLLEEELLALAAAPPARKPAAAPLPPADDETQPPRAGNETPTS